MVNKMIANNGSLSTSDPDYIRFKTLASMSRLPSSLSLSLPILFPFVSPFLQKLIYSIANEIFDGLDTLTFMVYVDAKQQIASAKQNIAISAVVTSVLFVLIHIQLLPFFLFILSFCFCWFLFDLTYISFSSAPSLEGFEQRASTRSPSST